VPLNDLALHLLNDIDNEVASAGITSEFVFVNFDTGNSLSPNSVSQAMHKSLDAMGLADAPATPHDLKRSMATRLGELGVPRLIVGKLLNHSEGGVTRIYDRYEYAGEKAKAMAAWGERLWQIVSGKPASSNVVPLREAQAAE
jgi:integrase